LMCRFLGKFPVFMDMNFTTANQYHMGRNRF
jgi:hypothetical protein